MYSRLKCLCHSWVCLSLLIAVSSAVAHDHLLHALRQHYLEKRVVVAFVTREMKTCSCPLLAQAKMSCYVSRWR